MKITKILLSAFLACAGMHTAYAYSEIPATDVPDSLTNEGQVSVVRSYTVAYKGTSATEGTCHFQRAVMVLNKRGDDHANWKEYISDKMSSITSFSGVIYDANGRVVSKIKKSEMKTSEFSQYLATGTTICYYEHPTMVSYPYTIVYDWDVRYKDGIVGYPVFSPIEEEYQSLKSASYSITLPDSIAIDHREMSTDVKMDSAHAEATRTNTFTWTFPACRAIVPDEYTQQSFYRFPLVIAHPLRFSYLGTTGELKSWETLGKWSYDLTEGRDILPDAEKEKVKGLVQGLTTKREKVKALYEYLGRRTRYVAILLGLGGYQPMTADEVSRTGFGDCKALSNFMHSMLKSVGIESYLTDISTNYEDLIPEFPNFHQLNHVILCVPDVDDDTLYLDCTAADVLPFGLVPTTLWGHECILLKPEGGELARIPADFSNMAEKTADIYLNDDYSVDGKSSFVYNGYGHYFEHRLLLHKAEQKKKDEAMNEILSLNGSHVTGVEVKNVSDSTDVCAQLSCHFSSPCYGKKMGTRLMMNLDPFSSVAEPKFRAGRTEPIVVPASFTISDSITIHLPQSLSIESMPQWMKDKKSQLIINNYGMCVFIATISDDGKTVHVLSTVTINKGTYPASKKDEFLSFFRQVRTSLSECVVVKKDN